ncbi:MAG: hypothetical protein ACTSUE_13210 [Promethearchaeota archaeon]
MMSGGSGGISPHAWLELTDALNFIEIKGHITDDTIMSIVQEMDLNVDTSMLRIKSRWHEFKRFNVFNMGDEPFLFIKELWQVQFLLEIIGLHMGINYLDDELGIRNYMFGSWIKGGKKKPILITTYVKGQKLTKNYKEYMFELGRQYAYHKVLSLYDVDYRHFIVQQGIIVRIDMGRSFSNLDTPYLGFWEIGYDKKLKGNEEFMRGVDWEMNFLKDKMKKNQKHLNFFLDLLSNLGSGVNFFVDFDVPLFVEQLKSYWKKHLPFSILD